METNKLINTFKVRNFRMTPYFIFFLLCIFYSTNNSFSQEVSFMTYNIRLDVASDGPNQWSNRRDFLAKQVKFYEPCIMGIQEGLPHQVEWLDSALNCYSYTGAGRDDGMHTGEFSAIFYKKDIFDMESGSTFWLSESPSEPSLGWDAAIKRICTWAIFRFRDTKTRILVMNTHFDHIGEKAREESARLILKKIHEINTQNLPVVLMGDFNLEPDSEPIKRISKMMNDSYRNSFLVFGPSGTFSGFRHEKPVAKRIDYIFTDKLKIEVKKYAVLSDSDECRYPSDHMPVYVEAKIK